MTFLVPSSKCGVTALCFSADDGEEEARDFENAIFKLSIALHQTFLSFLITFIVLSTRFRNFDTHFFNGLSFPEVRETEG